jgi:hypothetical protein
MRAIWVTMLLLPLVTSLGLAQDQKAAAPEPPKGVEAKLLETPPAAPRPEGEEPKAAEEPKEDPALQLAYDGNYFAEALADLTSRLDVTAVCSDERVNQLKFYLHRTVPQSLALQVVCGTVLHQPRPALIVCKAEEVREGKLKPKVKADKHLQLKLEDAKLGETLAYLSELTGTSLAVTDAFAERKVTYSAEDTTLRAALEDIAKTLDAKLTEGFSVEALDLDNMLAGVEKLSDEDLERMFTEGLRRVQAGGAGGGPMVPQQDVGRAMQDGLMMFNQLTPEERRDLIGRGARLIERFGALTHRLKPETQTQLKQTAQPLVGLAIAGYISLPAGQRAEIAPLMKALQSFGW